MLVAHDVQVSNFGTPTLAEGSDPLPVKSAQSISHTFASRLLCLENWLKLEKCFGCRHHGLMAVCVLLQVLAGNTNTYLVVSQELELPFVASRVRFIPYSLHTRTVCMRVELYGCPWERKSFHYLLINCQNYERHVASCLYRPVYSRA